MTALSRLVMAVLDSDGFSEVGRDGDNGCEGRRGEKEEGSLKKGSDGEMWRGVGNY